MLQCPFSRERTSDEGCALNSINGESCYLKCEMIITKASSSIHHRGNEPMCGIYQCIKWWQTSHSSGHFSWYLGKVEHCHKNAVFLHQPWPEKSRRAYILAAGCRDSVSASDPCSPTFYWEILQGGYLTSFCFYFLICQMEMKVFLFSWGQYENYTGSRRKVLSTVSDTWVLNNARYHDLTRTL